MEATGLVKPTAMARVEPAAGENLFRKGLATGLALAVLLWMGIAMLAWAGIGLLAPGGSG